MFASRVATGSVYSGGLRRLLASRRMAWKPLSLVMCTTETTSSPSTWTTRQTTASDSRYEIVTRSPTHGTRESRARRVVRA